MFSYSRCFSHQFSCSLSEMHNQNKCSILILSQDIVFFKSFFEHLFYSRFFLLLQNNGFIVQNNGFISRIQIRELALIFISFTFSCAILKYKKKQDAPVYLISSY